MPTSQSLNTYLPTYLAMPTSQSLNTYLPTYLAMFCRVHPSHLILYQLSNNYPLLRLYRCQLTSISLSGKE